MEPERPLTAKEATLQDAAAYNPRVDGEDDTRSVIDAASRLAELASSDADAAIWADRPSAEELPVRDEGTEPSTELLPLNRQGGAISPRDYQLADSLASGPGPVETQPGVAAKLPEGMAATKSMSPCRSRASAPSGPIPPETAGTSKGPEAVTPEEALAQVRGLLASHFSNTPHEPGDQPDRSGEPRDVSSARVLELVVSPRGEKGSDALSPASHSYAQTDGSVGASTVTPSYSHEGVPGYSGVEPDSRQSTGSTNVGAIPSPPPSQGSSALGSDSFGMTRPIVVVELAEPEKLIQASLDAFARQSAELAKEVAESAINDALFFYQAQIRAIDGH